MKKKSTTLSTIIFLGIAFGIITYAGLNIFPIADSKNLFVKHEQLSKNDVETIVRDTIKTHPEIIVSALENFQEKQMIEMQEKSAKSVKERKNEIFKDASSPFIGNPSAEIVLVEFFDYSCGYCKAATKILKDLVASDNNIKVIFKEFPILSDNSKYAARIALAVFKNNPQKYSEFHEKLMVASNLEKDTIYKLIQDLGLPLEEIKQLALSKEIEDNISNVRKLGIEIGVRATPTFVLGEEIIPGLIDLEGFKSKIAALRKK